MTFLELILRQIPIKLEHKIKLKIFILLASITLDLTAIIPPKLTKISKNKSETLVYQQLEARSKSAVLFLFCHYYLFYVFVFMERMRDALSEYIFPSIEN